MLFFTLFFSHIIHTCPMGIFFSLFGNLSNSFHAMLLSNNACHAKIYAFSSKIRCSYCAFTTFRNFSLSSAFLANAKDHYKTLGLSRNATSQEIKAAFFELSKKYHPDMNPDSDDKIKTAEIFQNVTEAYEVLGSEEKRKIYDSFTDERPIQGLRGFHRTPSGHHTARNAHRQKTWTDLDIDFKDFEHFQRENRRKRQFRHWQAAESATENFWASQQSSKQYKDQRVLEREALERRLHAELMERKRRDRFHPPTFEQLYQKEEQDTKRNIITRLKECIVVVPFLIAFYLLIDWTKKR